MIISGGGEEIPRLALKLCNWINRIYGERKMRAKMRIHLGGGGGIYIRQLLMFKKNGGFFFCRELLHKFYTYINILSLRA